MTRATRSTPVDVVVATNRLSPFLEETIASVVAQSHRSWTLTVVDDGSPAPDALRRAIANVPNATVVRSGPAGVSAARNRGLREGTAPFVVFLDDDDLWHPERLAVQVAALEDAERCVGSYSAGWYVDGEGRRFGDGWGAEQVSRSSLLSGAAPLPRIVTLMVRRDRCEAAGGFNERFRLAEDHELVLRLALAGDFVALPTALVGYRRHSHNSSGSGLEGLRASLDAIVEAQRAARRLGDLDALRLLEANERRFREGVAAGGLSRAVRSLRDSGPRASTAELALAVRLAPGHAAAGAASAIWRRVRAGRPPAR